MHHRKKTIVILSIILLIATGIRFGAIGDGRFDQETVRDYTISKEILNGDLRIEGIKAKADQESTQQSLGPAYYYLIALGLWLHDPLGPYYIIALLNTITIAITFFFVKEFFNERTAIITTVLMAIAPWFAFVIGINVTTPHFITPFVIIYMYALYKVAIKKQDNFLILAAASFAFMTQFHLSTLWLLAVGLTIVVYTRRDIFTKKQFFYAIITISLLYLPFMIHNTIHNSWSQFFTFLSGGYEISFWQNVLEVLGMTPMVTTSYFGGYMLGQTQVGLQLMQIFFHITTGILVFLFGLGVLYCIQQKEKKYTLLLIWLLIPVILFMMRAKNTSPHYLYILLPVQCIIIAIILEKYVKRKKLLTTILIAIIIFSHSLFLITFHNTIKEQGGTQGLWQISYNAKAQVVKEIKKDQTILWYKNPDRGVDYLLKKEGRNTKEIQTFKELERTKGTLILERFSLYSYGRNHFTEEEHEFFNTKQKTQSGPYEIIHFPQ